MTDGHTDFVSMRPEDTDELVKRVARAINVAWLADGLENGPIFDELSEHDEITEIVSEHLARAALSALPDTRANRESTAILTDKVPEITAMSVICERRLSALLGKVLRPVTMQDVRLRAGEGKLSAKIVLDAVNAELRARATLSQIKETKP